MRKWLNLFEETYPRELLTPELITALAKWCHDHESDTQNRQLADRVIELAAPLREETLWSLEGYQMWRGMGISQLDHDRMKRGEPTTIMPSRGRLTSWSLDRNSAWTFCDAAAERGDCTVLLEFNASDLNCVVDLRLIYRLMPQSRMNAEQEVIAVSEPLVVHPHNIIDLRDPDDGEVED